MKRLTGTLAVALAAVTVAACGTAKDQNGNPVNTPNSSDDVELTQGSGLTIAMVTHSDEGSFWSVVKKGAEAGGQGRGRQADLEPVQQRPAEGGAADRRRRLPEGRRPRGERPERRRDQGLAGQGHRGRHPDHHAQRRAWTTTRRSARSPTSARPRRSPAPRPAPSFKDAGVKKILCVIHEQANSSLEDRCAGVKEGFGGEVVNQQVKGTDDIATTQTEIKSKLQADKSFDAVMTLNPDIAAAAMTAIKDAGSSAKLATFDLSPAILKAIAAGTVLFAVDQQQYLQGYLPIVFLKLFKTNANTVGGGQPVLTGPGFVEKSNAAPGREARG